MEKQFRIKASDVIAHAKKRFRRGKERPSMAYCGEKNPQKALRLALEIQGIIEKGMVLIDGGEHNELFDLSWEISLKKEEIILEIAESLTEYCAEKSKTYFDICHYERLNSLFFNYFDFTEKGPIEKDGSIREKIFELNKFVLFECVDRVHRSHPISPGYQIVKEINEQLDEKIKKMFPNGSNSENRRRARNQCDIERYHLVIQVVEEKGPESMLLVAQDRLYGASRNFEYFGFKEVLFDEEFIPGDILEEILIEGVAKERSSDWFFACIKELSLRKSKDFVDNLISFKYLDKLLDDNKNHPQKFCKIIDFFIHINSTHLRYRMREYYKKSDKETKELMQIPLKKVNSRHMFTGQAWFARSIVTGELI